MIFQGTVYHAGDYKAVRVWNDSVVKLYSGRLLFIKNKVLVIRRNFVRQTCVLIGEELDILGESLCQDRTLQLNSRDLVHVCKLTNRTMCALPRDFSRKCVLVPFGYALCVSPLVNMLKWD